MLYKLLFPTEGLCYFCKSEGEFIKQRICADCKERLIYKPKYNEEANTYSTLEYNDFLRDFLNSFKFENKSYLYVPFGDFMAKATEGQSNEFDLIIPVPIHFRREAKRGYNQSALLARRISEVLCIEQNDKLLIKTKNTKAQSSLNGLKRLKNLSGAFIVKDKAKLKGKNILLIDDIFTTGSTLKACKEALIENGAKSVKSLVLTKVNN